MSISLSAPRLGLLNRTPRTATSPRPTVSSEQPACDESADLRRLGTKLLEFAPDIGARTVEFAPGPFTQDQAWQGAFERLATVWSIAVGSWMTGEGEQAARERGQECLDIFAELAHSRAASIDLILRRCLCWREAAIEALTACSQQLGLEAHALAQASAMLQRSLDVTLVRLSEAFESERRRTDAELRFVASHDVVTGLPNRSFISERIAEALACNSRALATTALLFIDLDNFKVVNDTLGHSGGDELLRALTVRLRTVVRDHDRLARFGGDEFVVLLEDVSGTDDAERVAQRVLDTFDQPFVLAGGAVALPVSASVGVAISSSATVDGLLRDADIAMYRAKRAGKNRFELITSSGQRCRAATQMRPHASQGIERSTR